jgi:hypothetical protein
VTGDGSTAVSLPVDAVAATGDALSASLGGRRLVPQVDDGGTGAISIDPQTPPCYSTP